MLLAAEYIPYGRLTEGEAELLLLAREQALMAELEIQRGDFAMADGYLNNAKAFRQAISVGYLHSPSSAAQFYIGGSEASAINSYINAAKRKQDPAMNFQAEVNTSGQNNLQFDATEEQKEQCRVEALRSAQTRLASSGKEFTQKDLEDLAFQLYEACVRNKPMENIVNEFLEPSGPVMLYKLMPQHIEFNGSVANKRFDQGKWIAETRKSTGLSENVMNRVIRNGTLNHLEKTPEVLLQEWRPYIEQGGVPPLETGSNESQNIAFLTILSVLTIILGLLTKVSGLVSAIKQYRTKAYESIASPEDLAPLQADFNNNGIADDQETFGQSLTAPNVLGVLGSAATAIISQFFLKKYRWVPAVIGGAGMAYFGYNIIAPVKRWLVGSRSLTAKDLITLGYVEYNGEWYKAMVVSERSGISLPEIINGGKSIYESIKEIFDLIKEQSPDDTELFIGNTSLIDPGDT